jgi:hypothetical protein
MRGHQLLVAVLAATVLLLVPLVLLALQPLGPKDSTEPEDKQRQAETEALADARLRLIQLEEKVEQLTARVDQLESSDPQSVDALRPAVGQMTGQPARPVADTPPAKPAEASNATGNPIPADWPAPQSSSSDVAAQPSRQAALSPAPPSAPVGEYPSPTTVSYDNPAPRSDLPPSQSVESSGVSTVTGPNTTAKSSASISPTPTTIEPSASVVDVRMLSHPDGSLVDRVSDMVIQTAAQGWPVVLVRSGLKDETWWAQQSIARRGQQIACRVHFGNQQSVAASHFRLVVLFLDTSEEAVRFRSAREFKEIPKGIRRSKEFRFIRK